MSAKLKRTFTDEFIGKLKPAKGVRLEFGDTNCRGLLVRVNERGSKTFSAIYRVVGEGGVNENGKPLRGSQKRITLGVYPEITVDEARKKTLDIITKASKGDDPRNEIRHYNILKCSAKFEKVAEEFIEKHAKPNTVAWKNSERAFKLYANPYFGSRPIDSITRADINELLDNIVKEGKIGAAREVKRHICTLYNWAIDRDICKNNPALKIKRTELKPNEDAGRSLTNDEIKALWRAADRMEYPFGPMYQLLLLTGQRKSEWACASIGEINMNDGYLEIPRKRYKGRRDHIVIFSDEVKAIVEALPKWAGDNYYIFTTQGGRIPVSGFGNAKSRLDNLMIEELCKIHRRKDAKLKPYRVHDLRVTCETKLANLGFNQEIRDRVLGHAAEGLQKTYNKYDYTNEKREALQAYAKHIMEIVNA